MRIIMKNTTTFAAIAAIDLQPIKTKLMHVASGEGWSQAKCDAMEIEYRRFLYLMHTFPHEQTSPTADVDTFWHYHILDTMKYAQDCEQAFGYFMHHYPYVGLDETEEAGAELRGADRMRELYETTFGEAYIRAEAYGMEAAAAAYCMLRPDAKKVEGAQAAYCMLRPDAKKVEGAQAAYCMLRPDAKKVEGAQAAYCMLRPDAKKVDGAQAAYCMLRPDAKKVEGAQAAYCMLRPDAKKVSGAQAAYCMLCPDVKADARNQPSRSTPVLPVGRSQV
jgi:hypothetical protein